MKEKKKLITGEVVLRVFLYLSLRQGSEDTGLNPKQGAA